MRKADAEKVFKAEILPGVIASERGSIDKPARRMAWNDWTDSLCKNGEITQKQYATWTAPRWLETYRPHSMPRV